MLKRKFRLKLSCLTQQSKWFLLAGTLLVACGQQAINSNSDDKESTNRPVIGSGSSLDPAFSKALTVIQDNCTSCHTGRHSSWASLSTSDAWVSKGLIVAGDSAGSRIISRLKNRGSNMPLEASALSDADVQILTDWIDNL